MRRSFWKFAVAAVLTGSLVAGPAAAQPDEGRKIIDSALKAQRSEISAVSRMIIVDDKGKQRERKVETKAKKIDGLWRTYLRFTFPPDVGGTQFLVLEKAGPAEDDLFLYQPINKRTRRITSAQRSGRFVGTDFFFEDLDIDDVDESDHKLLRTEKLKLAAGKREEEVDAWVVESKPKPTTVTSYSKIVTWVDRSNQFPRQVELYQGDQLAKRFRVFALKKDGSALIPLLSQMDDLKTGSKTIVTNESYSLNRESIPDQTFTETFLLSGG